ncbi:putative aminophospholipid-translocase [Dimargaris verticillata]|uniref:Phospholipid-transporting ATPase n=1 Tax=Dimargaris verticillata TaxID=2761393 RepID=A0A9W8EFT0_9FUNG|nr:putative aminophospholipid-translocase [Dimargaris verticillata]
MSGRRQRFPIHTRSATPDASHSSPTAASASPPTASAIPLQPMASRRPKAKTSDVEDHDGTGNSSDDNHASTYPALTARNRRKGSTGIRMVTQGKYMALDAQDIDDLDDMRHPSFAYGHGGPHSPSAPESSAVDIPDSVTVVPDRVISTQTRVIHFGKPEPDGGNGRRRTKYPVNAIKNNKYNLVTFIPLVLYEQFKFFFNLYFLLVALSQLVPALRIGYLFTYVGPLCFVLLVTMGKEAYDDWVRRRRDGEANAQSYEVLQPSGGARHTPSSKLKVGDLVLVHKDQRVPADCILLKTTEASGACFIRTDQLDGETDWKLRIAVPSCQRLPDYSSLMGHDGEAEVDAPHKDIYQFLGTLKCSTSQYSIEPLSVDNTLWANTVVASGTAVGLVMYTGKDTRAVMNTSVPKTKVGLLDLELNRISKVLFVVTAILSVIMVALTGFQGLFYIYISRFLILFSSIIPISLRVNLDMGKTFYAMQISKDPHIPQTVVRTSTIPEELGRLEYLLSDKTGTLTQNEMELKKLHMGTMSYNHETMDEITKSLVTYFDHLNRAVQKHQAHQEPDLLDHPIADPLTSPLGPRIAAEFTGRRDISSRVGEIVQALALCHNVTPNFDDHAGLTYQASSPDEVAIVRWTESVGLALIHRDRQSIKLLATARELADAESSDTLSQTTTQRSSMEVVVRSTSSPYLATVSAGAGSSQGLAVAALSVGDQRFELDYDILHIFPFTSESKRMGIIVRERLTGEITFYQKGADTVMAKIIQYNDWLDEECGNMAREGLRTLVIAKKRLSEPLYQQFDDRYQAAKASIHGRQAQMDQVVSEFLEHDLELLGLTGVEDKLQEDVKNTLELLRNAGLKIWMLTGDKVETATCIAVSTKLVARNQRIHQVAKLTSPAQLEAELDTLQLMGDCCLVIDGQSLQLALDHWQHEFLQVAMNLPAVVCCRCSPTQKAVVTQLIREQSKKRVCAIGDGGNDVSMIQAANVGVGIVGKEGKQASLAADFSITQFSHIARLLLWHGRNSYKRSAKMSQFVIHRGLIISVMQAVFSAMFYYAPIALYQGALMVGYTTVYTMAPVFSLVLDQDVSADTAMFYPELYKELTKGRALSFKTFFWWLLISVYQGGSIMMLAIWLFDTEFIHIVSISFTALIFNELLMVAFEIKTWHRYMIYSEIGSLLIYLGSIYFLKSDFDLAFMLTWAFVWKLGVIVLASTFSLYVVKVIKRIYAPPSYTKLM